MATANQMRAASLNVMRQGAVVITAADFARPGEIRQVQIYFLDGGRPVMDIVSKADLLENWPDEGVYVLNPDGEENSAVLQVGTFYDEELDSEFIRVPEDDAPQDELVSNLPNVQLMEAVEQLCAWREK